MNHSNSLFDSIFCRFDSAVQVATLTSTLWNVACDAWIVFVLFTKVPSEKLLSSVWSGFMKCVHQRDVGSKTIWLASICSRSTEETVAFMSWIWPAIVSGEYRRGRKDTVGSLVRLQGAMYYLWRTKVTTLSRWFVFGIENKDTEADPSRRMMTLFFYTDAFVLVLLKGERSIETNQDPWIITLWSSFTYNRVY